MRRAIRARDLSFAEALLDECGDAAERDPDCLNLRGLVAELRGRWSEARRDWVRAARRSNDGHAARRNLRRYYELYEFGCTRVPIALGDEPDFKFSIEVER
jgi:hypothetical protein